MESIRDSLDRLLVEPEIVSDETGCLALLGRLLQPFPSLLLLSTLDGKVRAAWSDDPALPCSLAQELAVAGARELAGAKWDLRPFIFADRTYQGFALRLNDTAGMLGGMLGGLVAADSPPALAALPRCLEGAGQMAWRAVQLQQLAAEMETHIRHLQAEHETLAVAHTEAMASAIEEQERRLREERERLAMERACAATEAANRAKSQFLAHMSHEIRTPLNAILGFTELLRQGGNREDEAERQEYLDTIYNSSIHLLELINDILDLSKIEAGQMRIERLACSPSEIIASVMSALRVRAQQKGLRFECQWRGMLPATIETDPLRVKQLLLNLLGNALKFTSHGEVRLVVSSAGTPDTPLLCLEVSDTGIGIAPDKLKGVFDAFVQGDNSVTREYGGTGLGLAISRSIARELGGDITVRSELGKGSCFTATIGTGPLAGIPLVSFTSEAMLPKSSPQAVARPMLPPARILIVEDGATNRKLLRLILQRAGATVSLAENGEIGLRMALQQPFDVILMDMQMPVMDGYTATRRLRERDVQTPIIALTAHAMGGDEAKCLQAGCSNYLSKPVETDRLLRCLTEYLSPSPSSEDRAPATSSDGVPPLSPGGTPVMSSLPIDDPDFREIVVEFVGRLETQLKAMQEALATGDLDALARLAHWLKGSGGTAGFDDFTDPARRLEQLARQKQVEQAREQFTAIRLLASRIVVPAGSKELN
jgi:signal transduction histidine kinase/ActR/RegA family two-component response regulator